MNSKNNKTSDSNRLILVQRLITDKIILTLVTLAFLQEVFPEDQFDPITSYFMKS